MSGLFERITQRTLVPEGGGIYDERSWTIEIDDEGGGEFVTVRNNGHEIRIDGEEWPALRVAIDTMMREVKR
jgi:hypothetical protein